MKNMVVAAHTLGCKVNQCDTDAVLGRLTDIGCVIGSFNDAADIYIINTCTVTHASDKKSRQMIRRARKQNPAACIAVCGCMTQNTDKDFAEKLDIDFVFDARKPNDFVQKVSEMDAGVGDTVSPAHQNRTLPTPKFRTRSFVKIQDGCDRFCAYCIVPYVRGKPKSRPVADIMAEIKNLLAGGTQEVVLTGIQVASYGEDSGDTNLAALIKQILSLDGLQRLRLSSVEPCAITNDFLAVVASSLALCDHFHLSLQSGSNATLQRMNRRYTTAEYAKIAASLRAINPNVALTTDIIVGFPGETDEEFNESLAFIQKIGFARIHVFEYSKREGTVAATLPNQVPDNVKTARSKKMR
ncbi:MAG: tRNA (N(6)-L-threonylcarbamoyladenosine(37)-C(2))-methylthiotransferase MtaB, partial [Defluviitaleaceae bacterium]|nr:tRNA (N(6)-L-threonylcarbamoyladenosine(37)-C(2))-methylthiotransferase MtaB [Defluviitaleaceae bacterium]